MPDAAAFQHSFGAALAGLPSGWASDDQVARALVIHRNTSARAIIDALGDNYPVIRQLVGDEAFAACASAFTESHPASDPRLCFYGENFDLFLGRYPAFSDHPYLADVAALERLCTLSLFASDAPFFDGGNLDLGQNLVLHPATAFARFAGPAAAIWNAHQPGADATSFDLIDWQACAVLVTRTDRVTVTELDEPATLFVELCVAGRTLGEAAAAASESGCDLSALFSRIILLGAFQAPTSKDLGS